MRQRPARSCLIPAAALAGAVVTQATAAVVERRGTDPALEGDVTIGDAGITVLSDTGAMHVVPWDRVRSVEPEPAAPDFADRMDKATSLWRARSRVERHDTTLAEPLLERCFEEYRGQTHETALVVAEGLLRCRLARGDHILAVIPALEMIRLRRAGETTESYSTLGPVFDEEYALCPLLAPAWAPRPRLEALAGDLDAYDAGDDRVVAAMAAFYRQAALRTLGSATDAVASFPEHPGVRMLALVTNPDAVDAMQRAIPTLPPWAEAWTRYAVGVALLQSSDLDTRQRGAVSLVHVPARFGRSQPYLAALAVATVADALEREGESEAAANLRVQEGRQ